MITTVLKRLVGVVAALALALGIGLAAAGPAEAAKRTVWDKVAQCESGGRWHISTGNGYYGGLQFSASTWRAYGGKKYASRANRASKAEQIAIARRVLAGQGPGAWPTCGRRAHLTRHNGKANRHATPESNPGRSSATQEKSSASKKSTATKATGKKLVKVKRGDTLSKIAHRHDVTGGWKGLWKLNKKTVKNPNRIHVGQVLKLRK